ncbi:DUF2273 domain-containing protein [Melissococcus sp. OM08-11BH]|uniref:DUF2273 domain-containing protein n=1 Tax=Enterococcaceae TaxID=81852 RepID=UPI000E4AC9FA|nr:DUF2273 domain-containing protein [Melissococcus sp. OM08-11BH]
MLQELLNDYKLTVLFGIIGLFISLSIIIVGFFKTLFVLIFTLLGCYIGFYLQSKIF